MTHKGNNVKEIRPEYDVKIEYKPTNLTPENIWRLYQEVTTYLAEHNSDNPFIYNSLKFHDFIDFDKVNEQFYGLGLEKPFMTCFGPVMKIFYFHHSLRITVNQFGKWHNIRIDLRDRPFPEEVHKDRESKCSCFHKQPHYWSEGGGCLDDGSPRHATICPQCYKLEYDFKTKIRMVLDRFLDPFVPNGR